MITETEENGDGSHDSGTGKLTGTGMALLMRLLGSMSFLANEADRLRNIVSALTPYGIELRTLQREVLDGEMSDEDQLDLFTSLVARFTPLGRPSFTDEIRGAGYDTPVLHFSPDDINEAWLDLIEEVLGLEERRNQV